jgi:hypothetical protein
MDGSEKILDNYADPDAHLRDAVSYTTALSLSGSWHFYRTFTLYGELDLLWIVNPRNIRANPTASDLQFTLGVSYAFSPPSGGLRGNNSNPSRPSSARGPIQ